MMTETQSIEQSGINTVRVLAADAVQRANSGHPGMPMGAAPMGHVLWADQVEAAWELIMPILTAWKAKKS